MELLYNWQFLPRSIQKLEYGTEAYKQAFTIHAALRKHVLILDIVILFLICSLEH